MTTDTSKAPERIWTSEVALFDSGRSAGSYYTDRYSSPAGNEYATEYVRSDIHDAMQARAEKSEVVSDKWMELAMGECCDRLDFKARAEKAEEIAKQLAANLENALNVLSEEDERLCCDGRECGCCGATTHQEAVYYAKEALDSYAAFRAALERKEATP